MANDLARPILRGPSVVTTDATKTTIATLATFSDKVYKVKAHIIGISDDAAEVAIYELVAGFKNDAGTLTQIGSTAATVSLESTGGWAATVEASAANILVTVTGAAATNIRWKVDVESFGTDYTGLVQA